MADTHSYRGKTAARSRPGAKRTGKLKTGAASRKSARQGSGDADHVGSAVQKAVRILGALVSGQNTQLNDIANAVGLPKPSVHRLLSQLEDVGLVQRDLDGRGFSPGRALVQLSTRTLGWIVRETTVRDFMREVVNRTQESCNLSILNDHEVEYLDRLECNFPLRMQLQAGSRVPLHCTAAGKLFLSLMTKPKRQKVMEALRLDRYTPNTITDVGALEAECERIQRDGISINREEFQVGLIGIAVPIRRTDGEAIAALSIHAPIFRMSVEAARQHVPVLQEIAAKIAGEFGPDRN